MNNEDNLTKIINYIKAGETKEQKIGTEFEHLIVEKESLETIAFVENGIEDILKALSKKGWQAEKEGTNLVGLSSKESNITVEPGGQFELSINPKEGIKEIKAVYLDFLADLKPILAEKGYDLLSLGYQPESKIDDIAWNPKQRYKVMSNYLEQRGDCSYNMMKGTASLQLALDYSSEEDFKKKFKIANSLSPILAMISDNSPFFEGKLFKNYALRTYIWNETDPVRTGIIKAALEDDFGYREYAEFIYNSPPILIKKNGEYIATGEQTAKEIYQTRDLSKQELEHILTMVFPDVRVKNFIEIRMMDAVPPELAFSLVAFIKGLFYNQHNLDRLYHFVSQFKPEEIIKLRKKILLKGFLADIADQTVIDVAKKLLNWSKQGLTKEEQDYLNPLTQNLNEALNPALIVKKRAAKYKNKRLAIKDSIVNDWKGEV